MSKIYCIYHQADMDGKTSAAIVRYFEKIADPKNELIFFGSNYEPNPEFFKEIEVGSKVYLVDISLPKELMLYLKENHKPIWIDHHNSAIEDSKKYGYSDMKGLRRNGTAGCELTWEWFTDDNMNLPYIVRMLGRFDVWDQTYAPQSFWINTYLDNLNLHPIPETEKAWEQIFDILDSDYKVSEVEMAYKDYDIKYDIETILTEGEKLFNFQVAQWAKDAQSKSFDIELTFEGKKYKGVAANGAKGSTYFNSVIKDEHVFMMTFSISKDRHIYYGLYADDNKELDLGAVAKKLGGNLGGGGHKNAAAFRSLSLPWDIPEIEII